MKRLKRRADFLAAATGSRIPAGPFMLQARVRGDRGSVRVGFTVTKKTGNAVERNRIRRRLRELVRLADGDAMRAGHDYVLIGRRGALNTRFERMNDELVRALKRAHAQKRVANQAK